jgi:hypothetical protein
LLSQEFVACSHDENNKVTTIECGRKLSWCCLYNTCWYGRFSNVSAVSRSRGLWFGWVLHSASGMDAIAGFGDVSDVVSAGGRMHEEWMLVIWSFKSLLRSLEVIFFCLFVNRDA